MQRVTGIGGIFFKAKDPRALARWYEEHLGIGFGSNLYFSFSWRENNDARPAASTSFGIFSDKSNYFDPSKKQLMLNLRVENLEELLKVLKQEGISVQDKVDKYAYGNFGWLADPEGNKIELWEPIESGFGEDEKVAAERMKSMNRVTGISGIFFKAKENEKLGKWYNDHLGIPVTKYGHTFMWRDFNDPEKVGSTVFSIFPDTTKYIDPGKNDFMINFRVKDLDGLMAELKKEGVQAVGEIQKSEYGNFGWVLDSEGNKIELWQPVDEKAD